MKSLQSSLLSWYHQHKRDLPFRQTRDPYKVWLSEIMLQQTTVTTVLPYYTRFLKRFPNIQSVANAPDTDLLSLWQGLGYYARIRNFKKACQHIVNELGGTVPTTYEGLKNLSGVGDYTAAAIASICFNKPHAVIDGNVKRVLTRWYRFTEDINQKSAKLFFEEKAACRLDKKNPGDFNQAMMELGATLCRPQKPLCEKCPVQKFCAAKDHHPETLPVKKKMSFIAVEYFALIVQNKGRVLLHKPTARSLIANMWGLPLLSDEIATAGLKKMGTVKHAITNKKITTHIYIGHQSSLQNNLNDYEFIAPDQMRKIPINTLSRKIMKLFYS